MADTEFNGTTTIHTRPPAVEMMTPRAILEPETPHDISDTLLTTNANDNNVFRRVFRKYSTRSIMTIIVVAVVQLVIASINLANRWSVPPSWLIRIPCPLQSTFSPFTQLLLISLRFLEFLNLCSALGILILGIYYLIRDRKFGSLNKPANVELWKPPNVWVLSLIFTFKIICAILLFTIVNYKLPTYAPYQAVAQKSCEIALSSIFFPLKMSGQTADFGSASENVLRKAAAAYFSNQHNHYLPGEPDFEICLGDVQIKMDENQPIPDCPENYFDNDDDLYAPFENVVVPNGAIVDYCAAGLRAGPNKNSNQYTLNAAEFPVQLLLQHLTDIVNGIALAYYGCSNTENRSYPINTSLTFSDVCQHFSEGSQDPAYTPYYNHPELAWSIGQIKGNDDTPTDALKEGACMYLAKLGDPQTGDDAYKSVLCSASTTHSAEHTVIGSGVSFNDLLFESVAKGPIANGFNHIPDKWSSLSWLLWLTLSYTDPDAYDYDVNADANISISMMSTSDGNNSNVQAWVKVDDVMRAGLLRWVLNDPQSIAQVNARYLAKAAEAGQGNFDKFAMDFQVTAVVMGASSLFQAAEKVSATLASSINKIRYLIGTFIGFVAVEYIIPFAISIITGIATGVKGFVALVDGSKAISHASDIRKLKGFNALMVLLTGLVTCLPILVIPIFVYQSFADQFFIITIIGVMLFSFSGAINGYFSTPKWGWLLTLASAVLMIVGMALWAAYDEDKLLLQAIMFGKNWLGHQNAIWIVGFIINFIFNFLFSRLIACNIVGCLTANLFSDFDSVYYLEKAAEYTGSKLHLLNVWPQTKKKLRSHKEQEKA